MGRHFWAGLTALGLVLATVSMANAQTAIFGFDDHSGSPSSGSYMPGDSFTFSITLAFAPGGNVANLDGLSYWFEQSNPSAPFYFSITNRDVTGSQFTFLQTANLTYPQTLSPSNSKDLGALTQDGNGRGPGAYFIANLTIHIDPSATAGIYQIENTTAGAKTSIITDNQGHTAPIPQAIYTITVVPEPSSIALLATGIPMALAFIRRRLR
jgi:hypothetical protein